MKVILQMHGSQHQASPHVTLKIVEADPTVRGQAAASSCKPALLENGLRVLVAAAKRSSSIRAR
jgi:hypothetical protein